MRKQISKMLITVIFLLTQLIVGNSQRIDDVPELVQFNSITDTINLEIKNYISVPDFRYGSSFTIKTEIDLIPTISDSLISILWKVNKSNAYWSDSLLNLGELNYKQLNIYKGLIVKADITKDGNLIKLDNFISLKDSVQTRINKLYSNESLIIQNEKDGQPDISIDRDLLEYYNRSTENEEIFLDIFFPEILSYFKINNKQYNLYEPNIERVKSSYPKFDLYEIEMTKNTMLVVNNKLNSEFECQFELTELGCSSIKNQLDKRIEISSNLNIENVDNFDCKKSRIVQKYNYDKQKNILQKFYQKKTITINDEPYYFWKEIIQK